LSANKFWKFLFDWATENSQKPGRATLCRVKGGKFVSFYISTHSYSYDSDEPARPKHGPLSIIPIDAYDGYISPSGGFSSYGCFDIRGKNLATKRKTRRYFEAKTEELACKLADESGMCGPYEISIRINKPAESWQLSELLIYEIVSSPIPEGLSYWDVRALHERIAAGDERPVPIDFARKAFQLGVKFSRCFGRQAIINASHDLPFDKRMEFLSYLCREK